MVSPRQVIAVLAHPACRNIVSNVTVKSKGGLEQSFESIGWPTRTSCIIGFYYKGDVIWNRFCHIFEGAEPCDWVKTMVRVANQTDVRERRVLQDLEDVTGESSTA